MVDVIRRAAELRLEAEPRSSSSGSKARSSRCAQREVRALLAAARSELGTTTAARERFRMSLLRRLLRGVRARARSRGDPQLRGGRAGASRSTDTSTAVLKAAWPIVNADRLVRSLLTSRSALAEAADGILSDASRTLLVPRERVVVGRRHPAGRRGSGAARRAAAQRTGT
jgi:hypothetical protein